MTNREMGCGSWEHLSRRSLFRMAGIAGASWLTPLASQLSRASEGNRPAKSLIVLWLEGAPSQLETFDPHPGTEIAAGSLARATCVPGIQLGEGLEQVAEEMESLSLIRAITSKEGDHARAIYNLKTGFRPDPTLVHPAIGSVICHELADSESVRVDIPRHISILPGEFPGRGGYLGDRYDAFKVDDPSQPVPDVTALVERQRQQQRLERLRRIDQRFLRRHANNESVAGKLGGHNLDAALQMMSSEQLRAFEVSELPTALRDSFGDTPFGRGCLAAIQLIEAGVRCVEVTLSGWDTHANNHVLQAERIKILDPALASLVRELKARGLLESTVVLCGGEFGRTPTVNPLGGRDHWPHGFAMAIGGGGIQGGRVIGETSPTPDPDAGRTDRNLANPHPLEDVHATVYRALGIDFGQELDTPIGRPMKISTGMPIEELF